MGDFSIFAPGRLSVDGPTDIDVWAGYLKHEEQELLINLSSECTREDRKALAEHMSNEGMRFVMVGNYASAGPTTRAQFLDLIRKFTNHKECKYPIFAVENAMGLTTHRLDHPVIEQGMIYRISLNRKASVC